MMTTSDDVVYEEYEIIQWIHEWANGITEEDYELL